jgi:hypothetical protein
VGSRGDALEAPPADREAVLEQSEPEDRLRSACSRPVALDATPRKQDRLWRDLVEGVGRQWNAVSYPAGAISCTP